MVTIEITPQTVTVNGIQTPNEAEIVSLICEFFGIQGSHAEVKWDQTRQIDALKDLSVGKHLATLWKMGFPKYTFKGESLGALDLRGANLRGADFSEARLREADFTGADLRKARFENADVQAGNFTEADLASANLIRAELSGANFTAANLDGATFRNSYIQYADFRKVNSMEGANFSWAYMCDTRWPPKLHTYNAILDPEDIEILQRKGCYL